MIEDDTIMTAREFARLVKEMRAVQKRYGHEWRSSEVIRNEKDLTRRVDEVIEDLLNDRPNLFGKEANG